MPCISVYRNNLHPGEIPECLKKITLMEKRLISRIHIFLTVIILPGGQFAEKGMAIDFPVSLETNVNLLPRKISESNIFTMSYGENNDVKPTHLIRQQKVFHVLH